MGQRLNIEIKDDDMTLACCYYHWSGYTGSSAELTNKIINGFYEYPDHTEPMIIQAVRLLRDTGASFSTEEARRILNDPELKEMLELFLGGTPDRSNGLIGVTEKEILNTEMCEEARVEIDITRKTVYFGAIYDIDPEETVEIDIDIDSLPTLSFSGDFVVSFDDWPAFYASVTNLIEAGRFHAISVRKDVVYGFIE